MIAIVDIKGSQYKIDGNKKLFVPKIDQEIGSKVVFDKVLMFSTDDKEFQVGTPNLEIKIEATVLRHVKDDKVTVFKKKRRKGYKVRRGHRQQYTEISIDKIGDQTSVAAKPKRGRKPKKETTEETNS